MNAGNKDGEGTDGNCHKVIKRLRQVIKCRLWRRSKKGFIKELEEAKEAEETEVEVWEVEKEKKICPTFGLRSRQILKKKLCTFTFHPHLF